MKKSVINITHNRFLQFFGIIAGFFFWLRGLKNIYWEPLLQPGMFTIRQIVELGLYLFVCAGTFIALALVVFQIHLPKKNEDWPFKLSLIHIIIKTVALLILFYVFYFSGWGKIFTDIWLRIIPLMSLLSIDQITLTSENRSNGFFRLISGLILLAGLTIITSRSRYILDFPFPLGWSEGNRLWDYSVLFASQKYINPTEQPVYAFLETGRQVLWGILFVIPNLSIQIMRLWNVILYIIPPIALGLILFRSQQKNNAIIASLFSLAFLSQGPVYPSLLFIAIGCALATSSKNSFLKLGLTALMCYYASTARFTWIAAPLVLMTIPEFIRSENNTFRKLTTITLRYVLAGIAGGLVLPSLFPLSAPSYSSAMTANQTSLFHKALTMLADQPLIWGRLWPNSTNNLGIIGALALAVLPLLCITLYLKNKTTLRWTSWQTIFLATVMGAALAVGLTVSVKIGGGSNLHNMDMFMLSVLFLAAAIWQQTEPNVVNYLNQGNLAIKALFVLLAILPAGKSLLQATPLSLPDKEETRRVLNTVSTQVSEKAREGEVLFIDHRQLLAFDLIPQVPLVVEYEKKVLMNEALSSNEEYFKRFYKDLKQQRFALIVNEPLFITYQADDALYGQENDAYVRWVSEPLLCYYEPLIRYDRQRVELLAPRTSPRPDNISCPE